jgi:hypothetical protein
MKRIFTLASMIAFLQPSHLMARTLYSTTDGNFNNTSTWVSGLLPAAGDTIYITSRDEVTVNSALSYSGSALLIIVFGELKMKGSSASLTMPTSSAIDIQNGGELESSSAAGGSQTIKAGSVTLWTKASGNISGPAYLGSTPLPITLLSFKVTNINNYCEIKWETANEYQCAYYIVEASNNGVEFEELYKVYPTNSNYINHYEYSLMIDHRNYNTFRLMQVDLDGSATSYYAEYVNSHSNPLGVKIWPNPASTLCHLQLPTSTNESDVLTISDLSGKIYTTQNVSYTNTIDLPLDLANGLYILNLKNKGWSSQLMVLR